MWLLGSGSLHNQTKSKSVNAIRLGKQNTRVNQSQIAKWALKLWPNNFLTLLSLFHYKRLSPALMGGVIRITFSLMLYD